MRQIVTPSAFRETLATLHDLGAPADPRVGFFGPTSTTWRVLRASSVLFGGARAGLLQLAHPAVAQAIADHSTVAADVQGRLRRTLSSVYTLVFGDQRTALQLAGRVFSKHRKVVGEHRESVGHAKAGSQYHANAVDGLRWVAATLMDSALEMYELTYGELYPIERDRFVDEQRRIAALFGIPDEASPRTWAEHRAYFDAILSNGTLAVGVAGQAMGRFVIEAPNWWATPTYAVARPLTAALMPEALREPFGLSFGRRDRAIAHAVLSGLRGGWSRAPLRVQWCPAWFHAQRRLQGLDGPDPHANRMREFALRSLT